ncbi:MAG: DNA methylase [Candidatus Eisenbacteria sp.]|nr:DNA methylase [Candidatus Eisenbacteria bacterium]
MTDRNHSLFPDEAVTENSGPVECLGMTFESDEARRTYFLEKLKEKLPELRKRSDFPVAEDEDILRLSDPPYYTACPNPFLSDFVERHGRPYGASEPYHREPFAVDVSEGKTDQLYRAHGYHTKVPHLAIVPSILHYTKPGDIVLDGFCGSGMTGVAAQWCGTAPMDYRRTVEQKWKDEEREAPEWGARRVILGDLSPAATFIAANYNLPFDVDAFATAAQQLLDEVEEEIGWMYESLHTDGKTKGRINYTVWSEVFSCPECAGKVVFVKEALDPETKRVKDEFPCPGCGAALTKKRLERLYESRYDAAVGKTVKAPKRVPVLINYNVGKNRCEKKPDDADLATLRRIEELALSPEAPTAELPYMHMTHERARMDHAGVTHLHHFFPPRGGHALAAMWRRACAHEDSRIRNMLLFFVEQAIWGMSVLARYAPTHYSQVNRQLSGVYYIGSQIAEVSPWYNLGGKLKRLPKAFMPMPSQSGTALITTGDCGRLSIPDSSVDYVFTDPPFGENIYYADLNFLVESWHRVLTRAEPEAIIDRAKKKGLLEYQHLMQRCFEEYCRVLKPGRWMTVVFHNSKNAVWNAIQEAMLAAGFVVADVRTLDKKQGSYRQVTSTAVKQDLVISVYKPNHGLEERFKLEAGTEEGVWDFVRTHMHQLPVFVSKDGQAEVIAERQSYLLFDRMVAFHVLRGVTVPLSAAEFYEGLAQRFAERDGMYFLPDQVAEYDRKRMTVKEVLQIEIFVSDEASAIQWLRQQLTAKPQTFQEIHPQFMKELGGWEKHEKSLELAELLEQNFLRYDGAGQVPSQIHSYLSSNFKELRGLNKDDPALCAKAKDRWFVPDPRKAGDLEKLRDRSLHKEFDEYRDMQKRLKVFRLEAVRAGFKRAWQEQDYATIIAVARKIPEKVLQEDPKLLMWFDQALTRTGDES